MAGRPLRGIHVAKYVIGIYGSLVGWLVPLKRIWDPSVGSSQTVGCYETDLGPNCTVDP